MCFLYHNRIHYTSLSPGRWYWRHCLCDFWYDWTCSWGIMMTVKHKILKTYIQNCKKKVASQSIFNFIKSNVDEKETCSPLDWILDKLLRTVAWLFQKWKLSTQSSNSTFFWARVGFKFGREQATLVKCANPVVFLWLPDFEPSFLWIAHFNVDKKYNKPSRQAFTPPPSHTHTPALFQK